MKRKGKKLSPPLGYSGLNCIACRILTLPTWSSLIACIISFLAWSRSLQEHFEFLGIRMDKKKGKRTPALSINISMEAMSGLNKNKRKSMDKLIETLESPINKELESQDSYDVYLKQLEKLHKQPLKLVFESFKLKVNPTYTHIIEENLNKLDFVHSILTWVSLIPFQTCILILYYVSSGVYKMKHHKC
jgi:hypothetical protein